jgi:hypothetical protein
MQKEWTRNETSDLCNAINSIQEIESITEIRTEPAGYDEFLVWRPAKKIYGVVGWDRIADFCDDIQKEIPLRHNDEAWLLAIVIACLAGTWLAVWYF